MKIIPYPEESKNISLQERGHRITPIEHVKALCWLAGQQNGNLLEIGCNEGVTTHDFATLYPEKLVYAVDFVGCAPTMREEQRGEQPPLDRFCHSARHLQNVRPLNCHSATLNVDQQLEDVGFVFIDGDHSYQGVLQDSELALYTICKRGGGIIVWHDFYIEQADWNRWMGVKPYIDECLRPVFDELTYIENTCLVYLKI